MRELQRDESSPTLRELFEIDSDRTEKFLRRVFRRALLTVRADFKTAYQESFSKSGSVGDPLAYDQIALCLDRVLAHVESANTDDFRRLIRWRSIYANRFAEASDALLAQNASLKTRVNQLVTGVEEFICARSIGGQAPGGLGDHKGAGSQTLSVVQSKTKHKE